MNYFFGGEKVFMAFSMTAVVCILLFIYTKLAMQVSGTVFRCSHMCF